MFELHPQLAADAFLIGELKLCLLLLNNDSNYPWFILVPKRAGISEFYELSDEDRLQFMKESIMLSKVIMEEFKGDKLNVAMLGNVVPQLHAHHIVRYRNDIAFPSPVWGKFPAVHYTEEQRMVTAEKVMNRLRFNTA